MRGRQTYNDIALALVRSAIERGDPSVLNGDLDRYRAVTPPSVHAVAREYLLAREPHDRSNISPA